MTENDATAEHPAFQGSPGKRWTALIAWAVIVVVVVFVFVRQRRSMAQVEQTSHDNSFQRNLIELQGRQLVGTKAIAGRGEQLYEQAKGLDRGSFRQRLRFAVLAGELVGPEKALQLLDRLKPPNLQSDPTSAEDRKLYEDLRRLYAAYKEASRKYLNALVTVLAQPQPLVATGCSSFFLVLPDLFDARAILPAVARDRLRKGLGWFGELALAPAQGPDRKARQAVLAPAVRLAKGFAVGILAALVLAAVGLVGLVALAILLSVRPWLRGFVPGSPYGAVYVETFALWLVLFVALSFAGGWLLPALPPLLRSSLLMLLSLVVLAWPVWRGTPWRQVRQDVGLYRGRGPLVETASGLATYVMALPLLFGGLILMLLITHLLKRVGGGGLFENNAPAHPLVGEAANDWWVRVQVVFTVSVAAPLVEETMFRGVFYRHLREATRGAGFVGSVLVSGLVSGFVFAVIHPQGALAVPLLMGLAFGFAVGREWRGSLLPCMVAHGVHNGIVVLFLLTALSG